MTRTTTRPHSRAAAVGALLALLAAAVLSSVPLSAPARAATYVPLSTDLVGPDVSSYQHPNNAPIDWARVKAAGADFAFVKATEGGTYTNPYFAQDWAGLSAQGLYRGAYHYANPAKDPVAQAQFFVSVTGSLLGPRDLPPVLDLEATGGLSSSALITWTSTYLSTVQRLTGRVPMIYTYPTFWNNSMAGTTSLSQYPLWIASYGVTQPQSVGGWTPPSGYTFWQYTSSASLDGIPDSTIDMNVFHGTSADLAAMVNTRQASGTNPSTSIGAITVAGTGSGTVTASKLAGAPVGVDARAPQVNGPTAGGFYDVSATSAAFTDVLLRFHKTPSTSVFWWSGTGWAKLAGTTRDPATGDLLTHLTAGTTPSVDQLADAIFAPGGIPVGRIAGADRLQTAIAASQAQFPAAGSASAVVLARSDLFADALAGGPLAAAQNGPLLLTPPNALDSGVAAELARVAAPGAPVYLLGGTGALSATVAKQVQDAGFVPQRLSGTDRYQTAVKVADTLGDPDTVFLADGTNFPDALSAGPAAILRGGAILLTRGTVQDAATKTYLAAHHPSTTYAVGGPAAAADKAAAAIVGQDRTDTSARVAKAFFPTPTRVGVAVGDGFADAMVAATGLAATGSPLLLSSGTGLSGYVTGYLTGASSTIASGVGFGGTGVLPASVLSALQTAAP